MTVAPGTRSPLEFDTVPLSETSHVSVVGHVGRFGDQHLVELTRRGDEFSGETGRQSLSGSTATGGDGKVIGTEKD